jgi:dTDP-4-amino-4,6-dideoxygalactose transaminase
MFYLVLPSLKKRAAFIQHLKNNGILSVFHYLSLHKSPFYKDKYDGSALPNSDLFSDRLVRLPLFPALSDVQLNHIVDVVKSFFSPKVA